MIFTSAANKIWLMSLILFFTNVGPNLANDITNPDENMSIYDYLGESIEQSLFMRPVDEEEVITTVTGCTKKKSSDVEGSIGYLQTPRAYL